MPKPKHDIPVPRIQDVEAYDKDVPATYKVPLSFVRCHRPTQEELENTLEYIADTEDENWLKNNSKFGLDGCLEMMGTTSLKSNSPCSPHCILSGNWLPLGAALLLTVQPVSHRKGPYSSLCWIGGGCISHRKGCHCAPCSRWRSSPL